MEVNPIRRLKNNLRMKSKNYRTKKNKVKYSLEDRINVILQIYNTKKEVLVWWKNDWSQLCTIDKVS